MDQGPARATCPDRVGQWDAEGLASAEPGPAKLHGERMLDADVRAALDALQPDFRAAVILCHVDGLPRHEFGGDIMSARKRLLEDSAAVRE